VKIEKYKGLNKTIPGVQVNGPEYRELMKLISHIFPTIITLGCDSDVLVRQLFQPLVLQIVHYYTCKQKIESKETAILIDTIMVKNET
jgi:hypothetical protein